MVVTKTYIKNLREKSFMKISASTEKRILEKFRSTPGMKTDDGFPAYTEQDILEQIRKMVR